jgi:glycosyltransferase involved in cell wall biosynthesis
LAVITTDRPPMNEVVDHDLNGILVPAGDPTALAKAVIELAGDASARRRLGEAARSVVAARFSIETTARQVERLYSEVLEIEHKPESQR